MKNMTFHVTRSNYRLKNCKRGVLNKDILSGFFQKVYKQGGGYVYLGLKSRIFVICMGPIVTFFGTHAHSAVLVFVKWRQSERVESRLWTIKILMQSLKNS